MSDTTNTAPVAPTAAELKKKAREAQKLFRAALESVEIADIEMEVTELEQNLIHFLRTGETTVPGAVYLRETMLADGVSEAEIAADVRAYHEANRKMCAALVSYLTWNDATFKQARKPEKTGTAYYHGEAPLRTKRGARVAIKIEFENA